MILLGVTTISECAFHRFESLNFFIIIDHDNFHPSDYTSIMIMLYTDRSLGTIFRNERREKKNTIVLVKKKMEDIYHIHDCD